MRYTRYFLITLLFLLLISINESVVATNTGFSTESLLEKERENFLSNIKISMLKEEPQKDAINCFDVNQDGLIAIGLSNCEKKVICIYNENVFLYGYEFKCNGDFGIEWSEDNVNIYFIRSSVIVAVNPIGEVIDVLRVQNTIENNSYQNHYIYASKRTVGDTKYILKNNIGILNIFAPSYSQLIKVNENEVETVLYDAGGKYAVKLIIIIIFIIVFICIVVFSIIREFRKNKRISTATQSGKTC